MAAFHLTVVTPDGLYIDEFVQKVIVNSGEGNINILPHHNSYAANLSDSKLKIYTEDQIKVARLHKGFVQASIDGVTILTDGCY